MLVRKADVPQRVVKEIVAVLLSPRGTSPGSFAIRTLVRRDRGKLATSSIARRRRDDIIASAGGPSAQDAVGFSCRSRSRRGCRYPARWSVAEPEWIGQSPVAHWGGNGMVNASQFQDGSVTGASRTAICWELPIPADVKPSAQLPPSWKQLAVVWERRAANSPVSAVTSPLSW